MERLSFKETWKLLQETTTFVGENEPFPEKIGPAGLDEPKGWIHVYSYPDIYDDGEEEEEAEAREVWRLENLTMPRVFFCRCGIYEISFRNTSLIESSFLCNDFIDVDFTEADLSRCDFRCSLFENVPFVRADLSEADLRMASFENCDFTDAKMAGTKMTRSQMEGLLLSETQKQEIAWKRSNGTPPGICG